jgi:hypothetical protein
MYCSADGAILRLQSHHPLIVQDISTVYEYDDLRYPFEVKVPWEKGVTRHIEDDEKEKKLKTGQSLTKSEKNQIKQLRDVYVRMIQDVQESYEDGLVSLGLLQG